MINRENVIKGLTIERECVSRDCDRDCAKCDIVQDREWLLSVYDDALELLKEQETKIRQLRLALDIAKGTCKGISFETDEKFMGDL